MPAYQCNACGGKFVDPQPGGARYFHVCPWWLPPTNPELVSVTPNTETLAGSTGIVTVAPAPPPGGWANQNLTIAPNGSVQPIAAGAGVTTIVS